MSTVRWLERRSEVAALERAYALQEPHRPPAIWLILDVILTILLVFVVLMEEPARRYLAKSRR